MAGFTQNLEAKTEIEEINKEGISLSKELKQEMQKEISEAEGVSSDATRRINRRSSEIRKDRSKAKPQLLEDPFITKLPSDTYGTVKGMQSVDVKSYLAEFFWNRCKGH